MKKFYVILLSLALVLLAGCKSTIPVPQYVDQPVAKSGTEISTVKDIERSIVRAAASLGWKTKIKSEGEILATLDIRKHQLVVLIKHDDKNLTVTYQSSVNGTKVTAELKLHGFVVVFMTFWLSGVSLALIATIFGIITQGTNPIAVIIPIIMLAFGFGLGHFGFNMEKEKSIRELKKIFKRIE